MEGIKTNLCFICDKTLSDTESEVVKERGIQTLIKSAEKRENRDHMRLLKTLSSVSVHAACQKHYNNERLITAYLRKKSNAPPMASTSRRSIIPSFDFKTRCFLCAEEITDDFVVKEQKKAMAKRIMVHRVEKLEVKDNIIKIVKERDDEWGREILTRIEHVSDLVAVEARYHLSCQKRLYSRVSSGQKRGHRPATNVDEAMEYIFSYLTQNSEECQFTLLELMNQIEGEYRPDARTVKSRLLKKYEDDILIIEKHNQSPVICFRDTGYKLLSDNWYKAKSSNAEEERLRVVKEAAAIILADIRSQEYDTSKYPPPDSFLNEVTSVIPQSLQVFFREIIVKKKRGSLDKWNRICEALSHAVISAARPRSFLSPVLLGVSTYLYKKFGSRKLIDLLSSLGFAASYTESTLFETSAIMRPAMSIDTTSFCQFICDNADHNVNTIDGLNTVHIMGSIQCVTPHTAVLSDQNISRLTKLPSAQVVGEIGSVQLSFFNKKDSSGLKTIKIVDIEERNPLSKEILPSSPDFLWLYGKWLKMELPGWNGFMELATADKTFMRSKIIFLPFINFPPSQHDTIFTTLLQAVEKCKINNQKTCFVTFDQPLYAKAQEIVANNPKFTNVVVRLGGFHLLMSFLGSIGYIMAGSGLKELFCNIYAANSVEKMLAGHAYARAIRAHILCHLALAHVILDTLQFSDGDHDIIQQLIGHLDKSIILRAEENDAFKIVVSKFKDMLNKLENNGPTAKLWVQYFQMVTLVKNFIEAERMGNWQLHLDTIQRMLPYFHASGHFHYAKFAHMYLQEMLHLEEKMDPVEYHKFTTEGYFTIRRSDKFWSGIWSDMTIEQTLMRMMHSNGGLTRGRGISDSVLALWTLGMISLYNVCNAIEEYCNVHLVTSEQHVDARSSRVCRDNEDLKKLLNWFSQHYPFPEINSLFSISTGVVGDENINCHLSREKGTEGLLNMIRTCQNFEAIKFKRKDKIIPLEAVNSSIKVGEDTVPINPLMLFQRMCIAKKSDDELKEYLKFELSPFPLSLFSEGGMRKGTKSSLYSTFAPCTESVELGNNIINVVDGGYLLHKVVWNRNDSFKLICQNYVQYVQYLYGSNAVVVFDGYPEDGQNSTKTTERLRRSKKQKTVDVIFDESMLVQVSQERFLANQSNKVRLISMLTQKFNETTITVKQAEEDADVTIVNTAISLCSKFDAVFVIGEDVDLLVLLSALANHLGNIYFRKPGRGKTPERLYSANSLKQKEAAANILFLHAFSGCDTTSSLFNQGKIKFFSLVEKHAKLNSIIDIFKQPDATPRSIEEAGVLFLIALYGGDMEKETLEELRYKFFVRSSTKNKFNLSSLPPTRNAARYHAYRTYHQVQQWCGIQKNAVDWGWMESAANGLSPVPMTQKAAPEVLLKIISCNCKKGCSGACSCKKAGLNCSIMCGFCNDGQVCDNTAQICIDNEDEYEELFQIESQNIQSTESDLEDEIQDEEDKNQPGPSKRKKK